MSRLEQLDLFGTHQNAVRRTQSAAMNRTRTLQALRVRSARLATEDGISRAAAHAETVLRGWGDRAFDFFAAFSATVSGGFMTEDARKYAESKGLPAPPDKRAWGAVARRAVKKGIVKATVYGKVKSPNSHGSHAMIWEKP